MSKEATTFKIFKEIILSKWNIFKESFIDRIERNVSYLHNSESKSVKVIILDGKTKLGIFLQKIDSSDIQNSALIAENQNLKIDCASSSKPLILAALERLFKKNLGISIMDLEIEMTDELRNDIESDNAIKQILKDRNLDLGTIQNITGKQLMKAILKYSSNSGLPMIMDQLYEMMKYRKLINSLGKISSNSKTKLIRNMVDDEIQIMCDNVNIPNTYTTRYSMKSLKNGSPNTCNLDTLTYLNTNIWNGDKRLGLPSSFINLIKKYSSQTIHLDRGDNQPEFYNKLKVMFLGSEVRGIVEKQGFYQEFIDWNIDGKRDGIQSWHAKEEFPDIKCESNQTRGCIHMSMISIIEINGEKYRFSYALAIPAIIDKKLDPYTEPDQIEFNSILEQIYLQIQKEIWK